MTDNVELRLRFASILEEIAALYAKVDVTFDLEDWIRIAIRKRYSPGGPPPVPWRQQKVLGRNIGEALIGAAHLKVAAKMAGNDELAVAADRRIAKMLSDDMCPAYVKIIKLPPIPFPPEPPPGPDELSVGWQDFELLVSTLTNYHAGLPEGTLKDQIGEFVTHVTKPG
jgi:hypothetical protein